MPLFKGLSSKSTPKKAIDYITREDKAAFVSVRNLFEDEIMRNSLQTLCGGSGKAKSLTSASIITSNYRALGKIT